MPFVTRCTVLLALACATALAACGTSDEDELRGIVRELRSALRARDGQRACGLLPTTPRPSSRATARARS